MLLRDLLPVNRNRALAGETRRADPFYAMQRDMNRLFGEFWPEFELPAVSGGNGRLGPVVPRIDVSETEKTIQVTAELPGLEEKDIEVTFVDGTLTISGEHKEETEKKDEEKKYYVKERTYGSFQRVLSIGENVDQDKIKAAFKNGVLTVELPKAEEPAAKVKRVPIGK
jgi:HSP20 family protein